MAAWDLVIGLAHAPGVSVTRRTRLRGWRARQVLDAR